jgi:hypothetical protein
MPSDGDFKLNINVLLTPSDGLTEVPVDLSEIVYNGQVLEYFDPGGGFGWFGGPWSLVTIFHGSVLQLSPPRSTASPTGLLSLPPTGRFSMTSVLNQELDTGIEYTWSFNAIDVTHNSFIDGIHGGASVRSVFTSAEYTFTTEGEPAPSKPVNPTPSNAGSGILLRPTLSWEAG